jgi:hypothetical protein
MPSFREGGPDRFNEKEGPPMAILRDPDEMLVVLFKHLAKQNSVKTLAEGRPVFDDEEVCEIRSPGSKDVKVFPATAFARWVENPYTGEQTQQTYAERFAHQYRQFKAQATQTKSGTPLDFVPFLSEGRRAELRAQNVYTVEQLAAIEGAELKNLGNGGREMKNAAVAFIEDSKSAAPNMQMLAELEALKARNVILEEDAQHRKQLQERAVVDDEFDAMSLEQLREYIATNTGQAPHGSLTRKVLVRMAGNARPEKAA